MKNADEMFEELGYRVFVNNGFIHKDKIRAKIKELEQETVIAQGEELLIFDAKKDILKELLEGE